MRILYRLKELAGLDGVNEERQQGIKQHSDAHFVPKKWIDDRLNKACC